jgi:Helix-turn-helix domain
MSPIRYLKQLRMEKAKHLLETSFLSVKEITFRVGINDDSHFVRDFKKAYGKAPTQYRAQMNERPEASDPANPEAAPRAYHAKKSLAILFPTINLITYTVSITCSSCC